jgi:hypothetical protein
MKKLHLLLVSLVTLPLIAVKKPKKQVGLVHISDSSTSFPGDRQENGILHRTIGPVRMRIATTPKGKRTLANSELAQAALRERLKRVIVSEKK